jgi:hypothetical protein
MNIDLGFKLDLKHLIARLAEDPRLPGFQGVTLYPNGALQVIHRHGGVPFRTLDDLAQWLDISDHAS